MAGGSLSLQTAVQGVLAIGVLLSEFAMLRLLLVEAVVRVFGVQSLLAAGFTAAVAWITSNPDLYVLAFLTFAIKVVVIPIIVTAILRRLGGEDRVPATVPVPRSFLIAAGLAALAFAVVTQLAPGARAGSGLGVGTAMVLVGFFMMAARGNAVAQLVAFLSLENGVFLASVSLAPGLPLLVAVLLLLDILIPAVAFTLVMRVLRSRKRSLHTIDLTELRG
jgi:hydrogenase-4 component E